MRQVELSDQLYEQVSRRASAGGFQSVDAYIADLLESELLEETSDLEALFTAERLAKIDAATAEIKAGRYYTLSEFDAHLEEVKARWRKENTRQALS
jgi:Arc/MetJ-type ribon-helix-helix transcriptional regulator